MKHAQHGFPERRTLTRTEASFTGTLYMSRGMSHLTVADVGQGGFRLETRHAAIPGQFAMLRIQTASHVAEFKGRVVWCRFDPARKMFHAGLRALHDDVDVPARLSEVIYDALETNGAIADLYDEARDVPWAWSA